MKRTVLLVACICAVAFLTSSCVKTRVCECKSASNPSVNYNFTYEMIGKTQGTADCENQQTSGRINTPDYTCELK